MGSRREQPARALHDCQALCRRPFRRGLSHRGPDALDGPVIASADGLTSDAQLRSFLGAAHCSFQIERPLRKMRGSQIADR